MLTKFKSINKVLFLDPNNSFILTQVDTKKIDVILSPALYWVKKLSLPISNLREVRKLLPSIFEDTLPPAHYSYMVYKKGEELIAFAYEDKKILEFLKSRGISNANIKSIRFAQSEFEEMQEALSVNETQSIYVRDDIVVLVPSTWLEQTQEMDLENISLSKHRIKLQQFGHIVDNNSIYKITALLIFFIMIIIAEIFIATAKKDAILEDKDALFSKYKLQATMFQNKATFKKYTKIHTVQTKLRQTMSLFLSMKLETNQKIKSMEYKNKKLIVLFEGITKDTQGTIISKLSAKKLQHKVSLSENILRVEVGI